MKMDELKCISKVQDGILNFYDPDTTNPYIAMSANGPWIVTSHGAVLYDTGGYGMLGLGHNPPQVLHAMSTNQVQANIMTASFSQSKFMDALREEIGHTRKDGFPYINVVCLNSGSESNSLAMRIMDVDAQRMTGEDGPHKGRESVLVTLKGSFHGRTDRPAQASDSCVESYKQHLRSYKDWRPLHTVTVNDVTELRETFEKIDDQGLHVEAMLMEPVMGEGNPGVAVTRDFYDAAREMTDKYRSLLLVDSIQAGLRAYGVLSIMDYPDFADAAPPDFESFSKAINGGQYPLSVLALGPRVPEIYVKGLYGNTMTTNPRALEVACSVLETFTPELRSNIVEMGEAYQKALRGLQRVHPDAIEDVTGTGLLVACHLKPGWKAFGHDSVEMLCRKMGLGVIHGGKNALRFTPHFNITQPEIDLVADVLSDVLNLYRLQHFPN
eukprot:CAMPEP_0175105950 /NCGR_PEP_ID=MMETSP0086_2-20121207/10852_1 /TAXON_ID=136419 /ORGANISM="Unknown Unknown, Strain D1" /LENGTH=439 /DNA_ID=CAMNT_0016382079 /DNA_START=216 /DNA_END=1535 /DNA_ORIENTATION=+